MHTQFAALAVVIAFTLVGFAEQQRTTPISPGRKARINDVPTPGRFGGLRTAPPDRITIDTTGLQITVPQTWAVDPATGAQYRPGELLVQFRTGLGTSTSMRATAVQSVRGRIARSLPGNWSLVQLEPGASMSDSINTLRRRFIVAQVTRNYRVRSTQARPNDEFYNVQWNFDAINMPAAWQINPGARNDLIVAVIDSGLNTVTDTFVFSSPLVGDIPIRFAAVPDLVTSDRIVGAFDFIYEDEFPLDLGGHGTHVTGTIAQLTNNAFGVAGIAYNVKLMPLKVISGGEGVVSWDDIFAPGNPGGSVVIVSEAVRRAADAGAKIINMSLGGSGELPLLREAIEYAVSRGAFVAIAAGNSGDEGNAPSFPAAYAADIKGAIAVGAVARNLRRANYSSFHPYVEICAPGGEVTSDFDFEGGITQVGYDEDATLSFLSPAQKIQALMLGFRPRFDLFELRPFQGTSMATPHVAGLAALLYTQGIRSPTAIEEAIKRFARPIDARADECGAGLIDPRRALRGFGLAR